jgi:hypothetical protein
MLTDMALAHTKHMSHTMQPHATGCHCTGEAQEGAEMSHRRRVCRDGSMAGAAAEWLQCDCQTRVVGVGSWPLRLLRLPLPGTQRCDCRETSTYPC